MFEHNPYKITLPTNKAGRDFIVGDLHGCRSLLDAELKKVDFDTSRDRLFSVGDLVDRGPESEACLELLKEPWFHAVLGNHDAMLMAWIYGRVKGDKRQQMYARAFIKNDGWQWAKRFTRASEFLPLLEDLPFMIEVLGCFQVVHAERLDAHNRMFLVEDDCRPDHYIVGFGWVGDWRDHYLWGRSLRLDMAKSPEEQIDGARILADLPVYCGHTIFPEVTEYAEHIFLDTGAYKTGRLTLVEFGEKCE